MKNKSEDNTAEYPGREPEMQWPRDGAMYASKFVPGARVVKMLQDVVESSTLMRLPFCVLFANSGAVLTVVTNERIPQSRGGKPRQSSMIQHESAYILEPFATASCEPGAEHMLTFCWPRKE
jgi:hypothetical protein